MTFDNSVKTSFEGSLDLNGRSSRSEYWYYQLFLLMVLGIISLFGLLFADSESYFATFLLVVGILSMIVLGPANICVTVRRLHDVNRSGWFIWLNLIPYIGSFILLYFLVQPSYNGENEYGPIPD